MKKAMTLLVGLLLLAVPAACSTDDSGAADGPAASGTVDIGYAVTDTTNPFIGWLTEEVQTLAEAEGLTVQIADAANNGTTQLEQIENFIAMKVKVIAMMPVDPMGVTDVIARAQDAGIKVLVAGTDTGIYDVMMNIDQYASGSEVAQMGIEWLVDTFSDDGTAEGFQERPKVIVIKYTATIDGANRSNGIIDTITDWGYADVVVAQTEAISSADATSIMENMWQQNQDAALVLTYNADAALGVNEYLMGLAGVDHAQLAVFSADTSEPVEQIILASVTDDSVFRGTMGTVGPEIDGEIVDLPIATFNAIKGLTEGELVYGAKITDAVARRTPETIEAG